MNTKKQPLIVIVGPTACGKTALAIALAQRLNGDIVNADSRQIYRFMDIGSAKPTEEEQKLAKHHLIDIVNPDERFTLHDFQHAAKQAIDAIADAQKIPFLAGGTGLYIQAIADGLHIPAAEPDYAQRRQWEELAAQNGADALHELLRRADPAAATAIPAANIRRVIRALEIIQTSGQPLAAQRQIGQDEFICLKLGLNTDRAIIYARADARIDRMLELGLVEETTQLLQKGYDWSLPSMSSLGYRQMGEYLRGERSLADAVQLMKYATHDFIRRQLTWFRRDAAIHWLNAADPNVVESAAEIAYNFLRNGDIKDEPLPTDLSS